MKPRQWLMIGALLLVAAATGSEARAEWYAWRVPLSTFDLSIVRDDLPLTWFASCSCYFSSDCKNTNRGQRCDYVGDCMGGSGCVCRPKPNEQIGGVFICGDPSGGGQCDGVCKATRLTLARWYFVTRFDVAGFTDHLFQAYLEPARRGGGPAQPEILAEGANLELTGDWQLEIEDAVHHVLHTLLGRDFLLPTAHSRKGGEPRGRVLRVNEEAVQLVDTVRSAFVAALAGEGPPDAVDRAIAGFWESGVTYTPHHGGRCYPHGHPEYDEVAPCQISEVRAALDILLEGVEEAASD